MLMNNFSGSIYFYSQVTFSLSMDWFFLVQTQVENACYSNNFKTIVIVNNSNEYVLSKFFIISLKKHMLLSHNHSIFVIY